MHGYTYIPKQHEALLAQHIAIYLASNPYTIITPYYKEGDFVAGDSLVTNKTINGEVQTFANSVTYTGFNGVTITKTIVGFIIEGDLVDRLDPDAYALLNSLEGVVFKETNVEYLQFLTTL